MIWYGSILTVDDRTNEVGHYPLGVKAENKSEALGKLLIAAQKMFPGKRVDVRVNDGFDPVIDDPENVSLCPDKSKA